MTQVILAGRQLDPTLRGRIELVHGAGETMRALVDDILDVAKMETGELRIQTAEMDLKRLLEDAVTVWTGQAETKRIGIEFDLEHCPGKIIADEVRLRQIIFNLMSNAIKFTDRGQVRLAASSEADEDDDDASKPGDPRRRQRHRHPAGPARGDFRDASARSMAASPAAMAAPASASPSAATSRARWAAT